MSAPPTDALPSCVALILHHNHRSLLPPLFDSLRDQEGLNAICLIDNASSDDSVEFMRHYYPEVEIIENRENLDYGTAYNHVIATRGEEIVFIANNDIEVRPHSIRHALVFLKAHPDVASVSFEGLDKSKDPLFPCSCGPLRRFGKELSPARNFRGPDDDPSESPCYLWGAAACVRRDIFNQVRFDEEMDWGFEDVDLGWSIRRRTGMRNVFLPSATIFHRESHTARKRFQLREIRRMVTRNAILSFAKNATAPELFRAAPYIAWQFLYCQHRLALARSISRRISSRRIA